MSIDGYEREIAKRQTIELINESLKDLNHYEDGVDGVQFLNEMKTKYGK